MNDYNSNVVIIQYMYKYWVNQQSLLLFFLMLHEYYILRILFYFKLISC